jgi:hypothetical protein
LAVKKYPVTIYITTDCGELCDKASALLIERGVPHTQLDAMQPEANQRVTDLTNGQPAVPLVEIGKIVVQGFEEGRWNAALDKAGYPRDAMIAVTPNVPVADSAATASTDDVDADAEADADADATADADEDSDIYEPGVFEPAQYEVEE